jgi:hypothetical protein
MSFNKNTPPLFMTFIDKYNIPKFVDKIDLIKNCTTALGLFTIITCFITFINYRHNKEEAKINELIESNKKIIEILNKHNQLLEIIELKSSPLITINEISDNVSEISNITYTRDTGKSAAADETLYEYVLNNKDFENEN